jgi:hypothetical protein
LMTTADSDSIRFESALDKNPDLWEEL